MLPYAFLIFSPFIYTFQINDLQGGFRKEIIYFALLAFIAYAAKAYEHKVFEKIFYIALLLYPAIILTHEMLAIFLPYVLIVYISVTDLTKKRIWVIACMLVPSIISFFASSFYAVTPIQVTEILQSITQAGYAIDGGAIAWLDKPVAYGINEVTQIVQHEPYITYYLLVLLLSCLAFIPLYKQMGALFHKKSSQILISVSAFGTVVLFVVALDWGRFIYIHLVSLFILSLIPNIADYSSLQCRLEKICKLYVNKTTRLFVILFFIAYVSLWHIPHCCSPAPYAHNFQQINVIAYIHPYTKLIWSVSK
ncbi:MAG: hypothetical protein Q9M11_05360 [Mariprofundaceae bacterium]|nr:hypothetical protein [Mariprofundaceae bacterium]